MKFRCPSCKLTFTRDLRNKEYRRRFTKRGYKIRCQRFDISTGWIERKVFAKPLRRR